MVELVEINIGKKLAGEIADRESASPQVRREDTVTGEVGFDGFLGVTVIDNEVNEPEGFGTFDFATDDCFENFVVDAGEVAADVALEHVSVGFDEMGEMFECAVGAVAFAVGVGVMDEGALEDGGDDVAEGVVNDSVAVGCGGN
ncbi:MAG: hypothetical protein RLZZ511_2225 [Cyanobacteriota bacterium]